MLASQVFAHQNSVLHIWLAQTWIWINQGYCKRSSSNNSAM